MSGRAGRLTVLTLVSAALFVPAAILGSANVATGQDQEEAPQSGARDEEGGRARGRGDR